MEPPSLHPPNRVKRRISPQAAAAEGKEASGDINPNCPSSWKRASVRSTLRSLTRLDRASRRRTRPRAVRPSNLSRRDLTTAQAVLTVSASRPQVRLSSCRLPCRANLQHSYRKLGLLVRASRKSPLQTRRANRTSILSRTTRVARQLEPKQRPKRSPSTRFDSTSVIAFSLPRRAAIESCVASLRRQQLCRARAPTAGRGRPTQRDG